MCSCQLYILPPPSAAHLKGAAGSLGVIASAYRLCSVHVLCVCVLFVITCCVYPACLCGRLCCLTMQEHAFHPCGRHGPVVSQLADVWYMVSI